MNENTTCRIGIGGPVGSGKTALLFHALHALRMPCFLVNSYDLTLQSGSDAHVALHDRFLRCAQFAPCALLIDPLEAIAPENASRRIDRSASDNALLAELVEAKRAGVTVVGVTSNAEHVMKSVLRWFDEAVCVAAADEA